MDRTNNEPLTIGGCPVCRKQLSLSRNSRRWKREKFRDGRVAHLIQKSRVPETIVNPFGALAGDGRVDVTWGRPVILPPFGKFRMRFEHSRDPGFHFILNFFSSGFWGSKSMPIGGYTWRVVATMRSNSLSPKRRVFYSSSMTKKILPQEIWDSSSMTKKRCFISPDLSASGNLRVRCIGILESGN
jgi:hypothetical protein